MEKAGIFTGSGLDFRRGNPYPIGLIGLSGNELAMQDAGVSGIVRLISGTAAKPPFLAYRLAGDDRQRERGHWAEELMKRPNRWQRKSVV